MQKQKKGISTGIWYAQHPRTGQNKQHKRNDEDGNLGVGGWLTDLRSISSYYSMKY